MATVPRTATDDDRDIAYPTRDGRPMGETDLHRKKMQDLIDMLDDHFAGDPKIYVSGNLLVFDAARRQAEARLARRLRGPRRSQATLARPLPDLARGNRAQFVIEVTSKTTRKEDQTKKPVLYRDVIKVAEYFLFDPTEDYLSPPFQGYRLVEGEYVAIKPVHGRLPSTVLGLQMERSGVDLRSYDPATSQWLPTPRERRRDRTGTC